MARPFKNTEWTLGRPIKTIDWVKVDELIMAGCIGTEIAPHFDMHEDTFYEKFQAHHKTGFTGYSAWKKAQGDSLIRHKQFHKAVKGDNSMLLHLGKHRLGQIDKEEIKLTAEVMNKFDAFMSQLNKNQKEVNQPDLNNDETKCINDNKS